MAYRVYPCIYYQLHLISIRYTQCFVNVICVALSIGALWSVCILLLCSLEYTYFMVLWNLCAKSVMWNSFENFRFRCWSIGINDFKQRKICFQKYCKFFGFCFIASDMLQTNMLFAKSFPKKKYKTGVIVVHIISEVFNSQVMRECSQRLEPFWKNEKRFLGSWSGIYSY